MKSRPTKRSPNRLLHGLLCVSLLIHLVLFLHISKLYSSNTLTYIELTLQNISKVPKRSIPRPRHRPEPPDRPQEIKKLRVTQLIPHLKPINPNYAAAKFAKDARRKARRRTFVLQVPDNKADLVKLAVPCGFKYRTIFNSGGMHFLGEHSKLDNTP